MLAVRNLHRKLLLDDAGRAAVGLGTVAMLALSLSGLVMLARRLGGWRRLIGLIRGTLVQRLHGEVAALPSSACFSRRRRAPSCR